MQKLKIEATPLFEKILDATKEDRKILVLRGGTRSSKTFSTVQLLVMRLITGKFGHIELDSGVIHVVRKNKTTLKSTVMRDIDEIIDSFGIRSKLYINKTDRIYKMEKLDANGNIIYSREILCFGADDQQKLRGAKRDILYCNEANELGYKTEFFQLLMRTRLRVIIDLNPSDSYVWVNTEIEQKRMITKKDVKLIVSTYKDNPFLSEDQVREIENIKNVDRYLREVYGLGNYGKTEGTVFPNRDIIDELPEEAKYVGHGLDFGYSNDPCALVSLWKYDGCLIIHELVYKTHLTNPDLTQEMKIMEVAQRGTEIIADSAEPKSIEELKRDGRNIKPCQKGADSINFGIQILQGYKILFTASSNNLIREVKAYKWKEDKDGNATRKPIDAFNHGLDAARYCAMLKLGEYRPQARGGIMF